MNKVAVYVLLALSVVGSVALARNCEAKEKHARVLKLVTCLDFSEVKDDSEKTAICYDKDKPFLVFGYTKVTIQGPTGPAMAIVGYK